MGMNLDDPNFLNEFIKMTREIVQQELRKAQFDKSEYAKVVSVPSGRTCNIKLKNEGSALPAKINDGLTIANGDDVYITRIQNSDSNFLITMKK